MSAFKILVGVSFFGVLLVVNGKNHHLKHTGNHDKRIVGGEFTSIKKYPYQVAIEREIIKDFFYKFTCGGSIISEQHILTAAHCIFKNSRVRIGTSSIISVFAQTVFVDVYYKHPNYTTVDNVAYNDIAILKLKSKITFNDKNINKINLPVANSEPNYSINATLTGWGMFFPYLRIPSLWLMKADVPIISNEDCVKSWENLSLPTTIRETNLCTLVKGDPKTACSGDSGGPLVQNNTLIGIVSFGINNCATRGAPSVYTKVSRFVDWISEQLKK
ncbi:trypsin delta-like [Onthophagus taurus]|uniref:trypsin delta-like n=1 Tax=Onthophagus taurus TaxID=166361 RepID=UPI000C202FF7|nr:trypsin delta/gamma-like protein CG30031 [Onthophagus taurus]